jgi:hypothetical protein
MLQTLIGLLGVALGAALGAIATYITTRSRMRMELEHIHDREIRDRRLEHYQRLFHISRSIPREWPSQEAPRRSDLSRFREEFHNWHFGEHAGGLFLTPAAKELYLRLQAALVDSARRDAGEPSPLTRDEIRRIYGLASELRHQLTEDVGAAQPPQLVWTRPHAKPPSSNGDDP